MILCNKIITKALIRLHRCAGWSAPLLFANPRRQVFSRQGPYKTCSPTDLLEMGAIILDMSNVWLVGIFRFQTICVNSDVGVIMFLGFVAVNAVYLYWCCKHRANTGLDKQNFLSLKSLIFPYQSIFTYILGA